MRRALPSNTWWVRSWVGLRPRSPSVKQVVPCTHARTHATPAHHTSWLHRRAHWERETRKRPGGARFRMWDVLGTLTCGKAPSGRAMLRMLPPVRIALNRFRTELALPHSVVFPDVTRSMSVGATNPRCMLTVIVRSLWLMPLVMYGDYGYGSKFCATSVHSPFHKVRERSYRARMYAISAPDYAGISQSVRVPGHSLGSLTSIPSHAT